MGAFLRGTTSCGEGGSLLDMSMGCERRSRQHMLCCVCQEQAEPCCLSALLTVKENGGVVCL